MVVGGGSVELGPAEGLAEGPAAGGSVGGDHGAAVAGGDAEGEGLAVEERVALPVLAPVAGHGLPPRGAVTLHGHRVHVAGAAHVGDQHQVEVGVAVDGEPDAALLVACDPAVGDGDNAGPVERDALEYGLRHVEVGARRIAPAAVVGRERVVGRAEVGGRDDDGARQAGVAPAPGGFAPDLEAGAAAEAVVEERRAQRRRVGAVPLAVQVAVAASASCTDESR
jgi:hypothetical protein